MIIFSLCLLLFINSMSIGLVFPIFPPLFTSSNSPLFTTGTALNIQSLFYTMILAVPTLFIIFGAPFWGKMSDNIGRRQVLLIGLIGIAFSFFLSVIGITFGSLFLLFFSRAIAGFMDGSEAVAQASIADLSLPQDKPRNMSFATWAGTLGFIVGPIIGGFLADKTITGKFHYQIPFIVSSALTLINAYILYKYFPIETKKATINQGKSESKAGYSKLLIKGFVICFDLRIRLFSWLLFVLQFSLAAFFQLSSLTLVEKFHYTSAQVGVFTI
ncbi:MAG: MFS transporter [Neisseriaceae bacterium]